jgi:N-methylhydantoinase B
VRKVPCEVLETVCPLVVWKKELRRDSGGPGKYRGGLGQTMILGNREKAEFAIFATFERVKNPARGRDGGKPGANGSLELASGTKMRGMGRQVVPIGDRLVVHMPGGGGIGDPAERDKEAIAADIKAGYVSPEAAARDYGGD